MERLLEDIRYGIRMLLKNPGLTLVAALSLAIGIGANATIFSWVQSLLLRPIPAAADPDSLVAFAERLRSGDYTSTSYPDYVDFRDRNETLAGLAVYRGQAMGVTIEGQSERAWGALVSGNYFDVLGVKAALGRTFFPEEDRTPGAHAVAVVSHAFWQRRLAADPNVAGRTIAINGHTFTIVGVTAPEFLGTFVGLSTDLWVPMMMQREVMPGGDRLNYRGEHWLETIGRLKPGVSLDQANADLDTLSRHIAQEYPATNEGRQATVVPLWKSSFGAQKILKPMLMVLMAVVALVLLIACANVANLLLSRAVSRRKEIAIRLSMGATRWRLIRQLLTESSMLALTGGAGGALMAFWSRNLLMAFVPPTDMPVKLAIDIDSSVLLFTLIVSLATGLVFGLAPAIQATRPDLVSVLKDESARVAGGRGRLRNSLVAIQVALSLVLLICAALFLRSFHNGQRLDPGFDPENLVVASYDVFPGGYSEQRGGVFHQQVAGRISSLPGVESASLARRLPLGFGGLSSFSIAIDGYTPRADENMNIDYNEVAPGYFHTMSIRLVEGREFTSEDNEKSHAVIIINQTMARRFWPGESAIGKRIRRGSGSLEVVGVARDGKYRSLSEEPRSFMYMPLLQNYRSQVTIVARAAGNVTGAISSIREAMREMDANLPLYDTMTMREHLAASVFVQNIAATFLSIFGALALTLATVGLYSVMAYTVSQRTHEIGIRIALGAGSRDVLRLVAGQGMKIALAGVGAGLVGAFAVTRFLSSLLYEVSASDPLTFAGIAALLAGVALAACFVPARRAMKIDPVIALRYE
ncbi:MAG: ABC transporter permease [Acidobacteriota bacterium]